MLRFAKNLLGGDKGGRAPGRKRKTVSLAIEAFEDRCVPTIMFPFNPAFGAETVTRGSEHALSNDPVHLIFLGSLWNTDESPQPTPSRPPPTGS